MEFYDKNGSPRIYTDDGEHLFTFDGKPVAYIHEGMIYDFGGHHLGWLDDGWLINHAGERALFTQGASGGPFKPFTQFLPFKGFKQFLPFKGFREFAPFKPFVTMNWADSPW
jgi:hypothetical protein